MLPSLSEIKQKRKRFGLIQTELAQKTGVSQSLIAKVESGRIVPSYDKAKKLFDFLEQLHEESRLTASDVMIRKIYSIRPNDSIKKAVKLMEEKGISQLPVLENGKAVGALSEKDVLAKLGSSSTSVNLNELPVEKAMDEPFPTIQESTPFSIVSELLRHNQAVLVTKKGKLVGIVTKADMLKRIIKAGA